MSGGFSWPACFSEISQLQIYMQEVA
jgi:hypothetical protein